MTPTIDDQPSISSRRIDSPVGVLTLFADARALLGVYFEGHVPAPRVRETVSNAHPTVLDAAARDLEAYFADASHPFSVRLAPRGTELERAVWAELARIPRGLTRTYGAIATKLGRPGAARAVGSAVARNPLSIIVPCHRVIGANGALTGFAGGLARKSWLLTHEGVASAVVAPGALGRSEPTRSSRARIASSSGRVSTSARSRR
jgi:methylated-DNA-[protein]-cysteine S-methyltransferase